MPRGPHLAPGSDPRRTPWRRLLLSALAALTVGAPLGGGCATPFDPPSKVNSLRVLAVTVDPPYAQPGAQVTFKMTYHDGYVDPEDPDAGSRPVNITWISGCYNPTADLYYGCYESLAKTFEGVDTQEELEQLLEEGVIGQGDEFTLSLPPELLERPPPLTGPHYGLAYVFFLACPGRLGPVAPEGTGVAGSFPIGCFDAITGERLGPESFVPGYTQVYVFADGRTNQNPPVNAFTLDGEPMEEGVEPRVKRCPLTDEERKQQGCAAPDPYSDCTAYELSIDVPADVAEKDRDSSGAEDGELTEVVWVDYFADKGDLESSVVLVNDAQKGLSDDLGTRWIPPDRPGRANLWAVLHDSRGGASVAHRTVIVE